MRQIVLFFLLCICVTSSFAQTAIELASIVEAKMKVNTSASDTSRVFALLQLSAKFSGMAETKPAFLDSAILYIIKAEKLSESIHFSEGLAQSWLAHALIFRARKDTKESDLYAGKVLSLSAISKNSNVLAECFTLLGDNLSDGEKMSETKINYYNNAIAIYDRLGDKRSKAGVLIKLGNVYLMGGRYQTMINLLNNARGLYEMLQYPEKEMDQELLYQRFVYAYLGKDNYTEALKYALQSVRIIEKNKDVSLKAFSIYNNVALLNSLLKRYDTQAYFLNKALPIARKYEALNNDSVMVAQVLGNMVVSKIAQGKPAEAIIYLKKIGDRYPHNNMGWRHFINKYALQAYTENRQFDIAAHYYHLVVKQTLELDKFHVHQTTNYNAIIKYLIATKQYSLAGKYLKLNDTACRKNSQVDMLARNYVDWFHVDSLKGDYKTAIKHFELSKTISDSLINVKKASQLADLQVSYQTEKKDEEIKLNAQKILLLKKQGQYQQISLLHEKTIRHVAFAGLAMVLLLLGLSYNRYLLKRRTNIQLEAQQERINAANSSLQRLNDSLQSLLSEKEWLLKEIHHRVKNNLQIVISLLNTQSAYLDNEDALEAIRNSQHRMHAMSLIHQKLYQSENLATIDMAMYIRELVEYLTESFSRNKKVTMHINVSPVKLDVSQAVPLGLILNEAISNSIKYAFKETKRGRIDILLKPVEGHHYLLCIADNGIGLPEGFDPYNTSSLGMSLMQGLSQQLDGEFLLENKDGLRVCVTFKAIGFNNLETERA
jgi:two-component sensor histidine kinase